MFFQYKMRVLVVSKNNTNYSCEGGTEKPVPRDHYLSSLASLVMSIGDPRDGLFYPTLTLMMNSFYLTYPYNPVEKIEIEQPDVERQMTSSAR